MKSDINNNKVTNQEPRQQQGNKVSTPQQGKAQVGSANQQKMTNQASAAQQTDVINEKKSPVKSEGQDGSLYETSNSKDVANQYHTHNRESVNQQNVNRNQSVSQGKGGQAVKTKSDTQDIAFGQSDVSTQDSHARIAKRAYELYELGGQAEGQCDQNWMQAESENKSRNQ